MFATCLLNEKLYKIKVFIIKKLNNSAIFLNKLKIKQLKCC